MLGESFVALIVSALLSASGLTVTTNGSTIYLPSLDHAFIVTLSCTHWIGISLETFTYLSVIWIFASAKGIPLRRRTYMALGVASFIGFFFANVLRMVLEIYLLVKVPPPAYQAYLLNWAAFEEQIGISLMFAMFTTLLLSSYALLRRRTAKLPYY
jgi:hypothetical protein